MTEDYRTSIQRENTTLTVDNVTSNTILYCNVRVYSKELADLNSRFIVPQDETTVVINLGQRSSANAIGTLNADNRNENSCLTGYTYR